MRYLTFALCKGRLAKKTMELLEKVGITCEEMKDPDTRKLIFVNEERKLKFFLAKGPDVPTYVEYGAADIGVVGKDVILEIEIQGALKVKEKLPDTLLLFVTPPTADELKRRLIGRGTETMEVIQSRLSRAFEEAKGMPEYDYILVNDQLEECVDRMHAIIQSQHDRADNCQDFIEKITEEIAVFQKGE